MTKKTTAAASAEPNTDSQAPAAEQTAPPAENIHAPDPEHFARPAKGGSYTRAADGSLTPNEAPESEEQAGG